MHLLNRLSNVLVVNYEFFFEKAYSGNKKKSKKILDPLINNDKSMARHFYQNESYPI